MPIAPQDDADFPSEFQQYQMKPTKRVHSLLKKTLKKKEF